MPIVGVGRGANDPIDTVRCWRFDRKLATLRLQERGELIAQPSLKQLGVGDGRLPEFKQGADLGAVAFPGPACRVVPVVIIALRAKLSSYSRDSLLIDCRPSERFRIKSVAKVTCFATIFATDRSRHVGWLRSRLY
jgi:hypothetical protein